MPSLDTYSLAQLKEVDKLFREDVYYADLYNSCYSNAPKKVQQQAIGIRNQILSILDTALASGDKKFELPQLTSALKSFRSSAHATKTSLATQEKKAQNYHDSTKLMLDILDNFSKSFNYDNPTNFATTLVHLSKPADQAKFKKLQVYRALAAHEVALAEGKKHSYSRTETELLTQTFKVKNVHELDNRFTLEEIYGNLDNAYRDVCKVPFVETAFKTNHLKTAGVHTKNIMIGVATALGIGVLFSFVPIAGAPTVNASSQAIMAFWVGQMVPIAAIGLAGGTATSSLSALVDNRSTQNLRNQIKMLTPNQKEILFKLVQQYTPTRENNLTPKQAFKKLNTELQNNDIRLKWGFRKTAKFNHLVDTQKEIHDVFTNALPGATKRQLRKKEKYDGKSFTEQNVEIIELGNERLSKILSPKNPVCSHIMIAGTKSRTSKVAREPEIERSIEYTPTVAYAAEEELVAAPRDTAAEEQLKAALKRSGLKLKTIKFNFAESELMYDVTIKKTEAKSYGKLFNRILEDINDHIQSGDHDPVELSYDEGIKIGKYNTKRSVDVTVTPKKKK